MKARPSTVSAGTVIRNSVRALIVRNNKILLLRKRRSDGVERFSMPGGGQEAGEHLAQALLRECAEELGTKVEITGLAHVADVFKPVGGKSAPCRQQVEFVFQCRVPSRYVPHNGSRPDKNQVAVEWVGLQYLDDIDLRPAGMASVIRTAALGREQVYLGEL